MKMTILEMVIDILNDLNSDEVNSIEDTAEALQVAQIIKTTYYEMMSRRDWPHLRKLAQLESLADPLRKTTLGLPENLSRLDWLNYNKIKVGETNPRWELVEYLYPDQFILKSNTRNLDNANIDQFSNSEGVPVLIYNDRAPSYWTSFDDDNIVFDSVDNAVETTIQGDKVQALMYTIPAWQAVDNFTPNLPAEVFPALLAEAKSVSSIKLNQVADEKAEQQSKRQQKRMSNQSWRAAGGIRYANYGRNSSKSFVKNNPLIDRTST